MNVCGAQYTDEAGTLWACQYRAGHTAGSELLVHSWWSVKEDNDRVRAEQDRKRSEACLPQSADALDLASEICDGAWDEWVELLLRALHDRKRALRGTPGFTGLTHYQLKVTRELDGQRLASHRFVRAEDLGPELHFEASQPGVLIGLEATAKFMPDPTPVAGEETRR